MERPGRADAEGVRGFVARHAWIRTLSDSGSSARPVRVVKVRRGQHLDLDQNLLQYSSSHSARDDRGALAELRPRVRRRPPIAVPTADATAVDIGGTMQQEIYR